ncbi:MAG: SGNH/GDSL hydrolase family protein [Chloroflexota bacterium]|nr:SGNH/GDSL hydrolase family protein [Chloroflexota bacterium]
MRKRVIRAIIGVLFVTALTIYLLEAALWFIDPLGITTYLRDQSTFIIIPNAEGFTHPPGQIALRHWSYTIDSSGNRVMPAGSDACTLAFVGDSITFGQGVNDTESFAYQFALDYPAVQFINLGKIAYNIANIRAAVENHPADGYIYFITDNDDGLMWTRPTSEWGQPLDPPEGRAAIRYYIATFLELRTPAITDIDAFWRDFDALDARDDMLMFAMGSPLAAQIVERQPDVPVIPRWTVDLKVSWIDWHPNPAGHAYLMANMESAVRAFVTARCGD